MKKYAIGMLIISILITASLTACNNPESTKEIITTNHAGDTEPSEVVRTENSVEPNYSKKIDLALKENHQIHAAVYAPEIDVCSSYKLEALQIDPEAAAKILFPEDSSSYTVEYDERREQTVLSTEMGNILYARPISLLFMRDGEESNKYDAIGDLLKRYAEAYPEKQKNSLDFMTMDDAISLGEKILKDLGVCWQPVLQTSMAMNHQEMMQYQEELFAADENLEYQTYDPFDNVYVLGNLTQEDDAYLLRFGFTFNNLPIFGFDNEPSVQFQDGVFPPSASYAEIIITRNGVRYFDMIGGYRIAETYESKPILSAEDAVEKYKEKWDMTLMPMPEDKWRVSSLYLEYLPIATDDGKVLIPYWCFAREAELTNTLTGEKVWTALGGIRINAFTGEEHAYGG